jgi:integrase
MSKPTRRPGSAAYYARRVIPKDLRETYGKREIWKSLGVTELEAAKPLERKQQLVWEAEFETARESLKAPSAQPAPAPKIASMTPQQRAERERAQFEWERENDAYWAENDPCPDYDDLTPEEQRIRDAVDEARERWEQQQREEREFLRQERVAEASAKAAGKPVPVASAGTPLSSVVDKWAASQSDAKTVDRMRAVVAWFEDHLGKLPVETITPDHVWTFKAKLLEKVTASNARVKLRNLNTLLRFARAERMIRDNPAADITVTVKTGPEDQMLPFDLPALAAIFGSPVFADHERPEAGAGEAAYWLPLLALFTGARLNELGQLRPTDVVQETYVDANNGDVDETAWVIRFVADKREGLKLKNAGSARRAPVHPELVRLGFLDFVSSTQGQVRIFDALRPDKYGHISANWSKWFGRYLRKTCGVANDRMVFHSFRHSFRFYALQVGIPDVDVDVTP